MSDRPKFDGVELVATQLGFYLGAMVHPGSAFTFKGDKLPKWAKEPAEAHAVLSKPKRQANADTKPSEAQSAGKAKAQSFSA